MTNERITNLLRTYGFCVFYLAVASPVQSLAASAQDTTCNFACFAQYPFDGRCRKPMKGARLYSGRVLSVSRECPNTILHIQTEGQELPSVVEIQLNGCKVFAGRVGQLVEFGVTGPSSDVRRYPLACDLLR